LRYTKMGRTGVDVSVICLGCMGFGEGSRGKAKWAIDEDASREIIRQALEAGVNFFDTANIYSVGSSEEFTGRALRDMANREEIVLATKVYMPMRGASPNSGGLSRKAIMAEIDNSLRRLETDYVDLYQIHRWDYDTPIEETLGALDELVKSGKVRYIGASSMWAWQLAKALGLQERHGWARFVTMQDHYNLLYREEEREMLPLCESEGVGVIPWSPLARGRLARPWDAETARTETDEFGKTLYRGEDREIVERVREVAERLGTSSAQVALAWLLGKPAITAPIVGVTKPEHLQEAIKSIDLELSDDDVKAIEEPYQPHAVAGHV
jgi:aryl-alcohol dehydrogenase (NADP+)